MPRPIVILGPTAGRKSELAVDLALRLGGQVLSADSMQVYKHMDAGTAKPTPDERNTVAHHLVDFVEPTERFTVADWLTLADEKITQLQSQGIRPIVVGGTNLYIKALLEGLFEGPPADAALREKLDARAPQDLHRQLKQLDPEAAERIHPNDRPRLTRAIEVFHTTGQPISKLQQQWSDESAQTPRYRHDPILVALHWPTERINQRINLRVKAMFYPDKARAQDGIDWPQSYLPLPEETRQLEDQHLLGPQARQALGYKQCLDYVHRRCSLTDAFEQTKIQTRRFAKQQRTWLKRFRGAHWLTPDDLPGQALTDAAQKAIEADRPTDAD